jgi:hypothetical protein
MTLELKAPLATIRTIDTNFLNINQEFTTTKWNLSIKHPDIFLLDNASTAKLNDSKSGSKAIIGNIAFIPGTTQDTVKYKIHQGSIIHIGIATSSRDLTSLEPGTDLASLKLDVKPNTTLMMTIKKKRTSAGVSSSLVFKYNDKITTINTTGYTGQNMYPWLSDDIDGTGFSVSISRSTIFKTFVRDDGAVIFTTINESGDSRPIIFETGENSTTFDNIGFSNDSSFENNNKTLVVPHIKNTEVINTDNLVIGMISYNVSSGKFVGYTAKGWVNLND